jgi:four helix bundle protein
MRSSGVDTYRRLRVWQKAQSFVLCIYRLSNALPGHEQYSATQQIRRAAWSVHNNIAEGNARRGRAERRRFLDIAVASLAEASAMTDTLGLLYDLDATLVAQAEELRIAINGGLFAMLHTRPRH